MPRRPAPLPSLTDAAPRRTTTRSIELPTSTLVTADSVDYTGPDAERRRSIQDFLRESRERFLTAQAATQKNREQMRTEQRFANGGGAQWTTTDATTRRTEDRPCLEINRIPQFIRQVSNQIRASRSQIQIHPKGKGATQKLAAALQGLIRSVETDSDADVAYDTASEHQLRIGLGYVRLRAVFAYDDRFDQVARLERVRNPLAVYMDPTTLEADFWDATHCHVVGSWGKREYEKRWGTVSSYQSLTEFVRAGTDLQDWMPEGKVVTAEYFYVEEVLRTLRLFADGSSLWDSEVEAFQAAWAVVHPGQPVPALARTRQVPTRVPYWCLRNAIDILEGNADRTAGRPLPGTRIPIFPVIGDEVDLDGTVDYHGMVRDAMDPQRMYNFWASSIAETVALAPKAPWIAAAGQVSQYLEDWKQANRVAHSVLVYDPKSLDGNLVPPPQRSVAEPPIQGMVMGLREADNDLKAVMGLFDASLGQQGPEQSGKAIGLRQQQGQVANSNYQDNLQRTKRSIGRSLLEWLPVITDTPRVLHLVKPDGTKEQAIVHAGAQNAPGPTFDTPEGVTATYDIAAGHFDVTVSTGAPAATEREATQQWLLELFKILPQLAVLGADIVLENSDFDGAQQLAKRAKAMLPPQAQDASDPDSALPRLTAENAQLKQQAQQLEQALAQVHVELQTKALDLASRERVAFIQSRTTMAAALLKNASEAERAVFDAELARESALVDQIGDHVGQETAHQQALEQQQQQDQTAAQQQAAQHAHEQQSQGAQQQHEAGQQAAQQQHEASQAEQAQAAQAAAPPKGDA